MKSNLFCHLVFLQNNGLAMVLAKTLLKSQGSNNMKRVENFFLKKLCNCNALVT